MLGLSQQLEAVRSPLGVYMTQQDFCAHYPEDLDACLHILGGLDVDPHSDGWRLAPQTRHDLAELLRRITAYNQLGITPDFTIIQMFYTLTPAGLAGRPGYWAANFALWASRAAGVRVFAEETVRDVRAKLMAGPMPADGGN
jgi:hypothetical protein